MSRTVQISVIMAVRNCTAYVEEALVSVLSQTCKEFELIMLDDGSTDETPELAERLAMQDDRLRICRQERRGLAETLNRGIAMANGEFLARMDGDDVCLPERFERQVRHLQAHPNIAVVGTQAIHIDARGVAKGITRLPISSQCVRRQLMRRNVIAHPSVMMRKASVVAAGGYRTQFGAAQDVDLWLRLAAHYDLDNLPEAWLKYRTHQVQTTSDRRMEQVLCALAARWSADCCQRGLADPVDGMKAVTRSALLDAGFPEERLKRAELVVMGLSVRESLTRKDFDAATSILASMEPMLCTEDTQSMAVYRLTSARSFSAQKKYGQAFNVLAKGCSRPLPLLRAALSKMEDVAAWV